MQEIRTLFFDTWLKQGGRVGRESGVAPRPRRLLAAAASREVERIAIDAERSTAVLGHDAWGARRAIRRTYLSRIRAARRRILIENSYFLPDNTVRRALERAARRGVEVRVLVPRTSDVPEVGYAARALYSRMMRNGIHVHEWVRGMLHSKTGLVDDWATTGSYNLDYRSLRYNLEINVASTEPGFVAEVEASLRLDLSEGCEEIDPVSWRHRPFNQKLLEWASYLVRKLL